MTYIPRDLGNIVQKALREMPVVVITGMRQTGKSTFLLNEPFLKKRPYFSFDEFVYLESAKKQPEFFLTQGELITIDEAQKCPEIFPVIKKIVDKDRTPGRFLLSGSANFLLLKHITESLAGRAVYFNMSPMSRRELNLKTEEEPFLIKFFKTQEIDKVSVSETLKDEDVIIGGLPPVALVLSDRKIWFKGYEQTYLERDLRQLSQIVNLIPFRHLLGLLALRTGTILSLSELARDAKLSVATASRYLSLLEASFIVRRIQPYLKSRSSRLIKSPKTYISDSGLACYLAGVDSLEREPLRGAFFENYVAQNLLSIIESRWQEARLYYWHIQGRYEVDFVIEAQNKCIAIEVKAGEKWEERELAGLKSFLNNTENCIAGIVGYNGNNIVKLGKKLSAIPLSVLLS
ncbi:ATP-binding protein [Thermodesulfovibrio sp.]|uniref:ATP-binding protein n=1 Tax=Thermodesulfovibrio sp. TaxID=2067987 RepID=UPI0030AF2A77